MSFSLLRMMSRANISEPGRRIAVLWFCGSALSVFASSACIAPPDLKARLQSKPTAQGHADIGEWFAVRKQFDCAARSFELASELQPTSLSFAYLWGLSLSSAGHDEEAIPPLHHAAHLDPNDIRPHLSLGTALDRLNRYSEAEAEWRRALAIDVNSSIAMDGLSQDLVNRRDYMGAVALLEKAGTKPLTSSQSLNLGIALTGLGRLDDATKVLREGLNTDPSFLPIANKLALVLMLQGRVDEAYAVFDLALQKHPNDRITQLLYLRILLSSHSDKAAKLAQELLVKYPDDWEVLYLTGILASAEGDSQRTRSVVERSVALNPNCAECQRLLGSTLAKEGYLAGAKLHLQKAIAAGDTAPEVHYYLARVFLKLRDSEHAAEEMSIYQRLKTAQSDKVQAAGKAEEADQQITNGDTAKAAELYREAIQYDPDEPLLHYKLAKTLDKLNHLAEEKTELQQTIQLNPNMAEALNQMGYLAARTGDAARAEQFFRAALHASPSYTGAWINLAATLASEAKWDDAKVAVDHALEIAPDNVQARQLNEAIAVMH